LNQPDPEYYTAHFWLRSCWHFNPYEHAECLSTPSKAIQFYHTYYEEIEVLRKELESSNFLPDILDWDFKFLIEFRLNQCYGLNWEHEDDIDIFWEIMREWGPFDDKWPKDHKIFYAELLYQDTCLWFITHFQLMDLNAFCKYHDMSRRF
jgi:hypothetical protein